MTCAKEGLMLSLAVSVYFHFLTCIECPLKVNKSLMFSYFENCLWTEWSLWFTDFSCLSCTSRNVLFPPRIKTYEITYKLLLIHGDLSNCFNGDVESLQNVMTLHVREVCRAAVIWKEKCRREKCHKRRKGPVRVKFPCAGCCVKCLVIAGCSEDAAGQGGERQVNYYTEREGWDALHSPLCPVVLGFQHREVWAKSARRWRRRTLHGPAPS